VHKFMYVLIVFALISLACNLGAQTASTPEPTAMPLSSTATATIEILQPTDTGLPTQAPTLGAVASATPAGVKITAATGNLNIRRGPGVAYNALAGLVEGTSATASGRTEDGLWLFIPLPSDATKFGWISTQTGFSQLEGDVLSLPIQPFLPPVLAYIRNCTFHPMLVKPGDVLLKDQTLSPDNKKLFNPGEYKIYDQAVSNTLVKTLKISEGDSVDIGKDGLGNTYTCP
jgi:hypothetical protein